MLTPLKAIKAKCIDCMCGQAREVKKCPCTDCSLYPYRNGHNPNLQGPKPANVLANLQKKTKKV